MLAGIIASPSAYDPKVYPENALDRRNLVLEKMHEQGYITDEQTTGRDPRRRCPRRTTSSRRRSTRRRPTSPPGCASSWSTATAPAKAFFGGLKVKSTLDLRAPGSGRGSGQLLPRRYSPPTASVVVIDNRQRGGQGDGRRARLRGRSPSTSRPRATASRAPRSSRSSSSPRCEQGISPYTVYDSAPQDFRFGKKDKEYFPVTNYGDCYLGSCRHRHARRPVLRQLGLRPARPRRPARARRSATAPARSPARSTSSGVQRPDLDQPGDGARRPRSRA